MCGIAGIVSRHPLDRLAPTLEGLSSALEHRGPDDVGFLAWHHGDLRLGRDPHAFGPASVGLVHRRLSIVDLSERGWQPMLDRTRQYAIVFNGEIYNYPELRQELERDGVTFSSETDTEVLLNLIIRHGIDAVRRATGMFAFALLDIAHERLWLVRDPFGIKPLFYVPGAGTLAFASEIRPLIALGLTSRTIEPSALFDYLRHGVTDHSERTLLAGVLQVAPAHAVEVDVQTGGVVSAHRYWAPSLVERSFGSPAEAAEELRDRLSRSVGLHLRADVPVAATLSGGIDSSAIVCLIDREQGAADLATFSYIADEPALNEERYVDVVAAKVGVRPHKIHVAASALADDLDALLLTQEQPITTTSMWAQRKVFQQVHADRFKVVLDGQGADELFGGYPVFRSARIAALIRSGRVSGAVSMLRGLNGSRSASLMQALGQLLPASLQSAARGLVGRPIVPEWLNGGWFHRLGAETARPFAVSAAATDLKAQLFDATVATSLPMLLRYADRNAMAVSLENRVPFLTTSLAEFAFSLPDALLIGDDGTTKQVLRSAMRGVVPDEVLDRRDKIGFVTPEARWFAESPALRGMLRAIAERPLPPCFSPALGSRLRDVAAGVSPYGSDVWRTWNTIRWAELLGLEFPS